MPAVHAWCLRLRGSVCCLNLLEGICSWIRKREARSARPARSGHPPRPPSRFPTARRSEQCFEHQPQAKGPNRPPAQDRASTRDHTTVTSACAYATVRKFATSTRGAVQRGEGGLQSGELLQSHSECTIQYGRTRRDSDSGIMTSPVGRHGGYFSAGIATDSATLRVSMPSDGRFYSTMLASANTTILQPPDIHLKLSSTSPIRSPRFIPDTAALA